MPNPDTERREYARLEQESRESKRPRDLTAAWDHLAPLAQADPATREKLERFAASKRIGFADLEALGARIGFRGRGPDLVLAVATFGWLGGRRVPTAVKYRNPSTGERTAEPGSIFLEPLIAGNREALDYFYAE